MRVAAFTQGLQVPSARLRVRQLVAPLAQRGVRLEERVSVRGAYPPPQSWKRPGWGLANLASNWGPVRSSRSGFDAVILQRELLSTFATLERFLGHPLVLDVDDAVHLYRGGRAMRSIARRCDHVAAGNEVLATWYREQGKDVTVIPTAVDLEHYGAPPGHRRTGSGIVWVGTKGNLRFLAEIVPHLEAAMREVPDATLTVVSDAPPPFVLPEGRLRYVPWSPEAERREQLAAAVAVMPMPDDGWTRGKCSYKMLAGMASGLPVIVSPHGMNAEVLAQGPVGLGAEGAAWRDALVRVLQDPKEAAAMGAAGRRLCEARYSTDRVADQWADLLRRL